MKKCLRRRSGTVTTPAPTTDDDGGVDDVPTAAVVVDDVPAFTVTADDVPIPPGRTNGPFQWVAGDEDQLMGMDAVRCRAVSCRIVQDRAGEVSQKYLTIGMGKYLWVKEGEM